MIPYEVKYGVWPVAMKDQVVPVLYDTFREAMAACLTLNHREGKRVYCVEEWKVPVMMPPQIR